MSTEVKTAFVGKFERSLNWTRLAACPRRVALAAALLAGLAAAQQPVQASLTPYTFNFSDEYYLKSGAAFSSVFAGATGTASSTGIYQETQTGGTPVITRLSTSGVPGEYVQNTSPNLSEGLALNGWTQSLNYGQQVGNVFNVNSTAPYFQYLTGSPLTSLTPSGNQAAFTINSIDLKTSGTVTIIGEDASGHQIGSDSLTLTSGSTLTTYTLNWTGITTLWFSGVISGDQVTMDNIVLNHPVPVPEVSTMLAGAMLLLPFGASTLRLLRKNRTS